MDIGVLGGNGICCLGALGERGSPMKPGLGDRGGETTVSPASRGSLGAGALTGRSIGRGLDGRPGLMGGFATTGCSFTSMLLGTFVGLSIPAKEAGCTEKDLAKDGVGSGARALIDGGIGKVWESVLASLVPVLDFFDPDLDFEAFSFMLRLRSSCCFCCNIARSRSSASLVFLLPLEKSTCSSSMSSSNSEAECSSKAALD